MKISEILSKYNTDKITHHRYGDAYDFLFNKFNREDNLNILEIGTQKGGTLLAWKEYFPNADITGVDVVDVVPDEYRVDTVKRVIADIKDYRDDRKFDIVIDDGSHYLADMVYVISRYMVKLNNNGILIIEDIRNPELMFAVIKNLLAEIRLGHPGYSESAWFDVRAYDNRKEGAESSFMIAMIKGLK